MQNNKRKKNKNIVLLHFLNRHNMSAYFCPAWRRQRNWRVAWFSVHIRIVSNRVEFLCVHIKRRTSQMRKKFWEFYRNTHLGHVGKSASRKKKSNEFIVSRNKRRKDAKQYNIILSQTPMQIKICIQNKYVWAHQYFYASSRIKDKCVYYYCSTWFINNIRKWKWGYDRKSCCETNPCGICFLIWFCTMKSHAIDIRSAARQIISIWVSYLIQYLSSFARYARYYIYYYVQICIAATSCSIIISNSGYRCAQQYHFTSSDIIWNGVRKH